MISKIFCVEPCDNGKRIDVFLTAEPELSEFTRSGIKHLIEEGLVKDNDKVITRAGWIIKTGDIIDVIPKPHEVLAFAEKENIPLDIIYEDDAIAVVNKPQGMTVHPAVGNYHGTLANALLYHMSSTSDINGPIRPGIVHRIDKDTSGLLVVAKNNQSHVALATQIQNKTCKRTYLAVVEGVIAQDTGTIDKPIARDKKDRLKMAVDNMGKHAVTHYTILERFKENTLVQFDLETGRTHQIRVHAKYIGHPIVGDPVYGYAKQRFNLKGQLLHAFKLVLVHPSTHEVMTFTCPLPDYFEKVLTILRQN